MADSTVLNSKSPEEQQADDGYCWFLLNAMGTVALSAHGSLKALETVVRMADEFCVISGVSRPSSAPIDVFKLAKAFHEQISNRRWVR